MEFVAIILNLHFQCDVGMVYDSKGSALRNFIESWLIKRILIHCIFIFVKITHLFVNG